MSARDLRRLLKLARENVDAEISDSAKHGGKFARGLSSEGYAGGYRDALHDVEAILGGYMPTDSRRYWRKAIAKATGTPEEKL